MDSADAIANLPEPYRAWSRAVLRGPVPVEERADCSACPMTEAEGPAAAFREDVKCCSFHPDLPNHRVGLFFRELRPDLAAGRALLEAKLHERVGVTPLGIDRPASFSVRLGEGFGRSRELRCPYYVEGHRFTCGIWQGREATCATWFCKHRRGRSGRALWEALARLFHAVDGAVARWCLLELGLPGAQLDAIDRYRRQPPATHVDARDYEALWGEHRFGEHRFFAACHEAASGLDAERAMALGGSEVAFRASLVAHAEAELSQTPADLLRPGKTELVQVRPKDYVLQTYSPYDLQAVPRALVDVLALFDGRSTGDVMQAAAEQGVTLDRATLRHMVDFGLLVAV